MKFEYDTKTCQMRPKKNENIYFARSMSGGLRVDDYLNNIKYVIERNGTITFIFGATTSVNIYDRRNANIIAERVKRMFGQSHTYADYKMFQK